MRPHICDIVPETDGWAVLMDGRWVACYPSLHLAIDAATEKSEGPEKPRMRRLDVDGKFYDVATGMVA